MKTLRSIFRRLDALQRGRWFRISATILVLAVFGSLFGSLALTTHDLGTQRRALVAALTGQNLKAGDEHALSLAGSGTVALGDRVYRAPQLAERPELLFDEEGNLDVSPAVVAEVLLRPQYPTRVPRWLLEHSGTTLTLAAAQIAWLLLIIWMGLTIPFLLTLLGTALAVPIAWWLGGEQAAWAVGGIGLLTFTFVLLTRAALILYRQPQQVLAVAHTVLKEASRTRISLVFIVLILIVLPMVPLGLDPDSPLRFQIQTFISRSLGFTFYLAACLTLFLSCATVAFEIRDRQIWQLVTKPLGRFNYLLGKWLGVITVNLIIMVIAAVSSFTFIQYLRERPVAQGLKGQEDAQLLQDAVLTARVGQRPSYAELDDEQMRARVDDFIARDAELAVLDDVPLLMRRRIAGEIRQQFANRQRNIPPRAAREYVFEGLGRARDLQSTLTLRYRFLIMRSDEHETFPAIFYFNGDPTLAVQRTYVPTVSHVVSIPAEFVREDGSLSVTVVNLYEPPPDKRGRGAMIFEEKDLELLYKVGSFEGNFLRAVVIDWVKLAFLAMLGICCATFLSFPVACLMSFTIFVAGTIGPYLAQALEEYYAPSVATLDWTNVGLVIQWAFMSTIRAIAKAIVFLLEAFGEFRPTQRLVEGRLIEWSSVGMGIVKVGVVWSGLALVTGWAVIRKRQLAIYSGHG